MLGTQLANYLEIEANRFEAIPGGDVGNLGFAGSIQGVPSGIRLRTSIAPKPAANADLDEEFEPIFVIGCPRSGTTLLSVILDRHSEIAVPPETHFAAHVVPFAFPDRRRRPSTIGAMRLRAVQDLMERTPLKDLELEPAAVARRLHGRPATPAALLQAVLEEYAGQRRKSKVAEKTPGHELYVDQLAAWFPKARFVWIVRDGRAVVQSQRRMHWINEPVWQLCLHWRRSAIEALRFENAHPGKIFRIQYEDMLRDPRQALQPLHRFLGIRLEPQQLEPQGSSDVIPAYENGWKLKASKAIDVARCEAWRKEITRSERFVMNCLMGRHLSMFGYPETSLREFGPLGPVAYFAIDTALRLVFVPQIYYVARASFRGAKRIWQFMRRVGAGVALAAASLGG